MIFSSCGKENLSDNSNQDSAKEVITVTASLPQIGEDVAIPMFAFMDQTTQDASTSEAIDFPFKALGGFIHLTLNNIPKGVDAKYLKLTLLNGSNLSGTYNIKTLSKDNNKGKEFALSKFTVEKTSNSPDDKKVIVPISTSTISGKEVKTVDIPVIGTEFMFGTFTLVLQDENNNDILSTFMKTKEFNKVIVPSDYLNVNFERTSEYIDLSNNKKETANCYIVNHVGKYKLPLVYGNAIKDGKSNLPSYQAKFPQDFVDYKGNKINDPYICGESGNKNLNCTLVWQDVKDLVTGVQLSFDGKSLEFIVTDDKVEGNAIVAVKDSKGTIMWSWHIWLTNYILGEGNIELINGNNDQFLKRYMIHAL